MTSERSLIKSIVDFFNSTSLENLKPITVACEILRKHQLTKNRFKIVVEKAIASMKHLIEEDRMTKLLNLNLQVS